MSSCRLWDSCRGNGLAISLLFSFSLVLVVEISIDSMGSFPAGLWVRLRRCVLIRRALELGRCNPAGSHQTVGVYFLI